MSMKFAHGGFVSGRSWRNCGEAMRRLGFQVGVEVELLDGTIDKVKKIKFDTGEVFLERNPGAFNYTGLKVSP